ncbi:MAG: polyamine aminopropyltransferase [Candidatus Dasytiphilus stammeri]
MVKNSIWYEKIHPNFGQYFFIENILHHEQTMFQEIIIFQNNFFGRIMSLDGILQTTEVDEFIYHEMISHVPLVAYGHPKKVLIIGGGDGASLREVTKYKSIEKIIMVEIDEKVVTACCQYLPNHSRDAFSDQRVSLQISDGVNFVNSCRDKFDIIIVDCPDPIGPGVRLFSPEFYRGCYNCLHERGIFVAQNGVFFLQSEYVSNSYSNLIKYFKDVKFFQASVPSYYGGMMIFAWATKNSVWGNLDLKVLKDNYISANLSCRYYNPAIHISSFAMPQYVLDRIDI